LPGKQGGIEEHSELLVKGKGEANGGKEKKPSHLLSQKEQTGAEGAGVTGLVHSKEEEKKGRIVYLLSL